MQHQSSLLFHKANCDLAEYNLLNHKWCTAFNYSSGMTSARLSNLLKWNYRDAQDRQLWQDKTCPARTLLIMSWKALLLLSLLSLFLLFFFYFYCHGKWVGVQVLDPESWDMIFDRMRALPSSKHKYHYYDDNHYHYYYYLHYYY